MEVISHRGYWKSKNDKNSITAFRRSFELGFGTETDVRDYNGELVISHDVADSNSMNFDSFLELYIKYNKPSMTLALNIKADGLHNIIFKQLRAFEIENYFVFDMSIPDTIGYLKKGVPFFSRQSEYEKTPAFYDNCCGVWLDSFKGVWFNKELILAHLNNYKKVAIVSSELHKRSTEELWYFIKSNKLHVKESIILCTDVPEKARQYFNL